MHKLSEQFIRKITYKYEDEIEKELHKKFMITADFTVVPKRIRILDNPLVVTYQRIQSYDGKVRI